MAGDPALTENVTIKFDKSPDAILFMSEYANNFGFKDYRYERYASLTRCSLDRTKYTGNGSTYGSGNSTLDVEMLDFVEDESITVKVTITGHISYLKYRLIYF